MIVSWNSLGVKKSIKEQEIVKEIFESNIWATNNFTHKFSTRKIFPLPSPCQWLKKYNEVSYSFFSLSAFPCLQSILLIFLIFSDVTCLFLLCSIHKDDCSPTSSITELIRCDSSSLRAWYFLAIMIYDLKEINILIAVLWTWVDDK